MMPTSGLSPSASAVPAAIDVEETTDPIHALPISAEADVEEEAPTPELPPAPRVRHVPKRPPYGAGEAFWRRGLPLALMWLAFWLGLLHHQQLARALGL